MLYDNNHPCMLCDLGYGSSQELAQHLYLIHSITLNGVPRPQPPAQIRQSIAPPATYSTNTLSSPFPATTRRSHVPSVPRNAQYNNSYFSSVNANILSSPFVAAPRQSHGPKALPQQRARNAQFNHSFSHQTNGHFITPPNSTGTPSPYQVPRTTVRTPGHHFSSPGPAPQQASPNTPIQDYKIQHQYGRQVDGKTLFRQNMGHSNPHEMPQRALERQIGPDKMKASAPTPRSIPAPSEPPTRPAKLPTDLPPLPAGIYALGLTDADFDTEHPHKGPCTQQAYTDIPASYGLSDEHMFNANHVKVLGFGNLLRLAGRYMDYEIAKKINARRPRDVIKTAGVKRRLRSAVSWAAGRPEWQKVGDVPQWLDEKQRARQNQLDNASLKRKRHDGAPVDVVKDADVRHWYRGPQEHEHRQFLTPSPAKRSRPTLSPTSATQECESGRQPGRQHADGGRNDAYATRDSTSMPTAQQKTQPVIYDLISPITESLNPFQTSQNGHEATTPAVSKDNVLPPTSITATAETAFVPQFASSDVRDLIDTIGEEGAMVIINDLGASAQMMAAANNVRAPPLNEHPGSKENAVTGAAAMSQLRAPTIMSKHSESQSLVHPSNTGGGQRASVVPNAAAPVIEMVEEGENYDDIFKEWLEKPENFLNPSDLRTGSLLAAGYSRWMKKRFGLAW